MKTSTTRSSRVSAFGHFRSAALALALLCTGAVSASAQTWLTTGNSGTFNTAANWTNPASVPGSSSVATFGTSNATTVTMGSDESVAGVTFNVGASAYTFTGNNTLTLGSNGIVNVSGSLQVFALNHLNLGTGTTIMTGSGSPATTGNVNISGQISGGSLTKNGPSALSLYNSTNNYTGGTTISGGVLNLQNSNLTSGSETGTGAVEVQSGAKLVGNGRVAGLTTVDSGGILSLGTSSAQGTINFAAGLTLLSGSDTVFDLGATSDKVEISGGTFSGVGGGALNINLYKATGFTAGTYTLFDYTNATASNISASDFNLAGSFSGYTYTFINDTANNAIEVSIVASAVPEPSTYAAILGVCALGLVILRRRQGTQSAIAA